MKKMGPAVEKNVKLLQKMATPVGDGYGADGDLFFVNQNDDGEPTSVAESAVLTPNADGTGKATFSQDFPEVLEETPQNKARGRHSFSRSTKIKKPALPVRALAFPSQSDSDSKAHADHVEELQPSISPEKNAHSDEELFRSQSDHEGARSPMGLPVLTPYQLQDLTKKPAMRFLHIQTDIVDNKSDEKSVDLEPPALTPYKKLSKLDVSPDQDLSTGRRPRNKLSSTSNSGNKTNLRRRRSKVQHEEETSPKIVDDVVKTNETPTSRSKSERRRKLSSTSVASTSSSGRDSTLPTAGSGYKEKRNAKGETALHIACRAGVIAKVEEVVERGADINAKDNAGWTPIHEVINGKGPLPDKEKILRFLCTNGGDVNALGGLEDETPLHSAVLAGSETLVEILLEFRASPNIRNSQGQLPKDIAYNDVIIKLLDEKMAISSVVGQPSLSKNTNLNTSMHVSSSMLDEDPALMQVMLKKALIYFNYDVDCDTVNDSIEKLGLKVSETLNCKVTHVVHPKEKEGKVPYHVPISFEYLYALAHGMWQVSNDWITDSATSGACVSPTPYEILGHHHIDARNEGAPGISRMNAERRFPGLLHGFTFYLYKTCGYKSPNLNLSKTQLSKLITSAGGSTVNREPNPENIDPLQAPQRFHANNNDNRRDDSHPSNGKFTLTSHIILYDDREPPHVRHTFEHVKSLKSAWLIDSLLHFKLEEPANYL